MEGTEGQGKVPRTEKRMDKGEGATGGVGTLEERSRHLGQRKYRKEFREPPWD